MRRRTSGTAAGIRRWRKGGYHSPGQEPQQEVIQRWPRPDTEAIIRGTASRNAMPAEGRLPTVRRRPVAASGHSALTAARVRRSALSRSRRHPGQREPHAQRCAGRRRYQPHRCIDAVFFCSPGRGPRRGSSSCIAAAIGLFRRHHCAGPAAAMHGDCLTAASTASGAVHDAPCLTLPCPAWCTLRRLCLWGTARFCRTHGAPGGASTCACRASN